MLPLLLCSLLGPLSSSPATQVEPAERPWTLLIYGAADNNADGPILEFLDGIRKALDDDPGMEIVLFIDRSEGFSDDAELLGEDFHGARIYRLRKDSAELLDATDYFPGMEAGVDFEVDSADPEMLAGFLAFGKERFPAKHYGLMIYSHADGCTMCPDEESGRSMHIPELTDVIDEELSVDLLALELCNMAGLEIAYQWRPGNGGFSSEVLVAIPNAGPPLDWDRAFRRIRSEGHASSATGPVIDPTKMSPSDFGRLVIEEGHMGRIARAKHSPQMAERVNYEAAGCYGLRSAEAAKNAVDDLAVALAASADREAFEQLRGSGEDAAINYVRGQFTTRPYVDVYDLCARAASSDRLSAPVRARAQRVCDSVDELVISSFGMPGLGSFQAGKHGIFLSFPDGALSMPGPIGPSRVWNRMRWYSPLDPDGDSPYGRWSFLADGATPGNGKVENWFELLDSWFDDTSAGVEGTNSYAW